MSIVHPCFPCSLRYINYRSLWKFNWEIWLAGERWHSNGNSQCQVQVTRFTTTIPFDDCGRFINNQSAEFTGSRVGGLISPSEISVYYQNFALNRTLHRTWHVSIYPALSRNFRFSEIDKRFLERFACPFVKTGAWAPAVRCYLLFYPGAIIRSIELTKMWSHVTSVFFYLPEIFKFFLTHLRNSWFLRLLIYNFETSSRRRK